jgi:hypothetical protein
VGGHARHFQTHPSFIIFNPISPKKAGIGGFPEFPIVHLIGGFNPSGKYESDWIIIPTSGENKKCSIIHQPDILLFQLLSIINHRLTID